MRKNLCVWAVLLGSATASFASTDAYIDSSNGRFDSQTGVIATLLDRCAMDRDRLKSMLDANFATARPDVREALDLAADLGKMPAGDPRIATILQNLREARRSIR